MLVIIKAKLPTTLNSPNQTTNRLRFIKTEFQNIGAKIND